jgi:hypothetical protein
MVKEMMARESEINRKKFDLPIKIMCGYTKYNISQLATAANFTL